MKRFVFALILSLLAFHVVQSSHVNVSLTFHDLTGNPHEIMTSTETLHFVSTTSIAAFLRFMGAEGGADPFHRLLQIDPNNYVG